MSEAMELWRPDAERASQSFLHQLRIYAEAESEQQLPTYTDLHAWSIANPGTFWSKVWDDGEVAGDKGEDPEKYFLAGEDFISARFFTEAKLNAAQTLLSRGSDGDVAIVALREDGARQELTWKELRSQVGAAAAAMRAEGVGIGDRVVAWAPNVSELMIYGLAALSIGAIVSTASPDFAPHAVLDRFGQVEPKILLAGPTYFYGGKNFDRQSELSEIIAGLPSLTRVILIESASHSHSSFSEWISPFVGAPLHFEQLPFDHPGFVLFSSGTTGKPKCITHSAAGILLKTIAEQRYQLNLSASDRVFFFTTCGWMMWNWLFCVLASGATILLYDGSPVYPNPSRLIDFIDQEQLTFFGLSAKLIDTYNKDKLCPMDSHSLATLRTIGSTGSVLSPESFEYIYREVKADVHLVSLSGGTDICGCFLAGVPTNPVYRGELQGACLGMAVDVYDASGNSAAFGEKGELVCTVPFPSKPLGFWGDTNNEKYRAAYFEGFPGIWTHGDFASKSETGGFILYGRSDATLNSRGVRIGTAEIYRVVESFDEIQESMAVSQDWDGDTRIILFVTMKNGSDFSTELSQSIKSRLRGQASPRHVPDLIVVAPELPRTKSNKLVELAVTDVINGRVVRNRDALANASALDWFVAIPELQV